MNHRLIAIFLMGLLFFAAASLGLSYYTGYVGEQAVRQQLQLNQVQAARRGYELNLEGYERGWFKSRAVVRLEPLSATADQSDFVLNGELLLRHGPILPLENDWRLGLFALRVELRPDTRLGTVSLDVPVESLLDQMLIIGQFNGDYQISWTLPDLQLQQEDQALNLRNAELFWQGPYDALAGQGELSFDQLKVQWPGALSLTVTDSRLELELAYMQDWVLVGSSHLNSHQGVWAGPGQLPVKFTQLQWQWTQSAEQERVDTQYQLDLEKLNAGPLALRDLTASTHIRGLPLAALKSWQQLAKERKASGYGAFEANEWLAVANEPLRQVLRAEGTIGAKVGKGELAADWQAEYQGLTDGEPISATEWRDWAELLEARLRLRVSETALSGTPLYWLFAESVDRYLLPSEAASKHHSANDPPAELQRRFEAQWSDGKLELNP